MYFKLKMQTKNLFLQNILQIMLHECLLRLSKDLDILSSKRFGKHSLTARRRYLKYFKRFNVFVEGN